MKSIHTLAICATIVFVGCDNDEDTVEVGENNFVTSEFGFSANLSQDAANDLVAAGKNRDNIGKVVNVFVPKPFWVGIVVELIFLRNEQFREQVESENGPKGVVLKVWGVPPSAFNQVPRYLEPLKMKIERAILPDSWHQELEKGRAYLTLPVYWSIEAR